MYCMQHVFLPVFTDHVDMCFYFFKSSPLSRSTRFEIGGIGDHTPLVKVMT